MLLSYLLLLSAIEPLSRLTKSRNNVCKTFRDYYFPEDNENCYYDPDLNLEIPQLIKKYSGIVESHDVISEDGYIIKMFRIPRKNPKGVILLHHSIATQSHIYLWQGNNSLAMILWRHGFDVWLANQRGTTYSDKHVNLTNFDYSYWDFSFHEMGVYDVSGELELIREKTNGSKVIYFGHSLGSVMGLVYASVKDDEAARCLKSMILLATPSYFQHARSVIFLFRGLGPCLEVIISALRIGSPLLFLPFILPISRVVLRLFPIFLYAVSILIWISCGYTPSETDPTFFNYDGTIYADNFSWKTLFHFIQLTNTNNRFQMYDYGIENNMRIYGKHHPPLYPIEKIKVPTLIVSSLTDALISWEDNEILFQKLSLEAKIYGHWIVSGLNHLDYHLGLHRKEIFIDNLLEHLHKI